MRANQIRLCLSTVAYIVMRALRQFGLAQTELAPAQCDTVLVQPDLEERPRWLANKGLGHSFSSTPLYC
jgi:hypothetical protein